MLHHSGRIGAVAEGANVNVGFIWLEFGVHCVVDQI